MLRGSKLVPRSSPSEAIVMQDSGTTVKTINQCSLISAFTCAAWTTDAIGSTMIAERIPWMAPDRTFDIATSQIGQGA